MIGILVKACPERRRFCNAMVLMEIGMESQLPSGTVKAPRAQYHGHGCLWMRFGIFSLLFERLKKCGQSSLFSADIALARREGT